jgi:5'-nucleotidase
MGRWNSRALAATILTLAACGGAGDGGSASTEPVEVQILSVSTWLGQLDPIAETDAGGNARSYGGLSGLSAYFARDRAANPATLTFMTADSFGASPPLSAVFDDEPALLGMNFLRVTADTLGNHNFNGGVAYAKKLVEEASFPFVATNLSGVEAELGPSVATPYLIVEVGVAPHTARVAILGITSPDAPLHTFPGRFGSITVTEPVDAANRAAASARDAGARAVVTLTDLETTGEAAGGERTGPLIDFARAVVGVDVVLGYKATTPAASKIGTTFVVESEWKGRTYARTRLSIDGAGARPLGADIVEPDLASVTPDPAADTLLAPYRQRLAAAFDRKVGETEEAYAEDGIAERSGEASIGNLIADAMLDRYRPVGAEIAVMNAGGIRAPLPSSYEPSLHTLRRSTPGYAPGPPFDLVAGDAYTVLPFGNTCVVRSIRGDALWSVLEQSVSMAPEANKGFLQVSGFRFTFAPSAPVGARVRSVTLDGGAAIPRDDTRSYVMVDPDFVDGGGDGYAMLVQPTRAPGRDVMADVLLTYVQARPHLHPSIEGRIVAVP